MPRLIGEKFFSHVKYENLFAPSSPRGENISREPSANKNYLIIFGRLYSEDLIFLAEISCANLRRLHLYLKMRAKNNFTHLTLCFIFLYSFQFINTLDMDILEFIYFNL